MISARPACRSLVCEGVVREDIVELFRELGASGDEEACRFFLRPQCAEDHSLCSLPVNGSVGLQECVALIAHLGLDSDAATQHLRNKLVRKSFVSSASVMLQAMPPVASTWSPIEAAAEPAPLAAPAPIPTRMPIHVPAPLPAAVDDAGVGANDHVQFEISRLRRQESMLLQQLERRGSLSPAEESRLEDAREQLGTLGAT
eukprot:NODE_17286_length_951_cov_4.845874.p1 GENE.NODE_17286_length_951_cov_4.845874~~NODE_17286_length_951_cov_4.845874.p1  ORF type:complete len:201 (-),score=25.89 NODE_17286_length_951_cov_4.845874:176-778(-)